MNDTSLGDFARRLTFWDMFILFMCSAGGAGLFLFALLVTYREKTQ